jgi:hypothetical protein
MIMLLVGHRLPSRLEVVRWIPEKSLFKKQREVEVWVVNEVAVQGQSTVATGQVRLFPLR